nr:GNAT family N-acetyltransferase [Caenimonas aquaedulcis]
MPDDAATVSHILSAASAHLRRKGYEVWSEPEVSETTVAPHVRDGLYYIGFEGAEAVGVFRLELRDPVFWPEMPDGSSAYLHKLAVLPSQQGRGRAHALLRHAVGIARTRGLRFLRLDCMGGRPKLRAVYEGFGFRHHSQKMLGAQVFDRFELAVDAADSVS